MYQRRCPDLSKRFHVYVDWIVVDKTPVCIYVGKGCLDRCTKIGRNKKHTSITKKHPFFRAIVASFDDEQAALGYECLLINKYGTFVDDENHQYACNFTTGGEGFTMSKQSRIKLSGALIIANAKPETKKKRSAAQMIAQNTGDVNKRRSESLKKSAKDPNVKDRRSKAARRTQNDPALIERKRKFSRKNKAVHQLSLTTNEIIMTYVSCCEASRVTGIHVTNIQSCANGHRRHAGGFLWRFVEINTPKWLPLKERPDDYKAFRESRCRGSKHGITIDDVKALRQEFDALEADSRKLRANFYKSWAQKLNVTTTAIRAIANRYTYVYVIS